MRSWNASALSEGNGFALSAAFGNVLEAYNSYLSYHAAKATAVERFASEGLFEGWPYDEAERLFGLLLRSAWLAMASPAELLPGHCACRDTPETQSLLFEAFNMLRQGGPNSASYSLFQCEALAVEPDAADWQVLLPSVRRPQFLQCTPSDVVIRAACAQKALLRGNGGEALHLMDAAVNLLALAADCFDHTPWTGSGGRHGSEEPPLSAAYDVAAAEVFHNWALSSAAGRALPWARLPAPPRPFARAACATDLGPGCVDLATSRIVLLSSPSGSASSSGNAFLLQCGDSYGDWRRASLRPGKLPAGALPSGWLLRLSPLAAENLWHLLHVLLPALQRRLAEGGEVGELLVDGLQELESPSGGGAVGPSALRGHLAWHFLRLLSDKPPVLLGEGQPGGDVRRCYRRLAWGQEAVTLFGRDKGAMKRKDVRAAVALAARLPWGPTLPWSTVQSHFFGPEEGAPAWRLLYAARPRASKRAVVNEAEVVQALQRLPRARVALVDFAGEALAQNAAVQWRLAASADLLVGPHGAGLAWAAFMREGSVLVELMPHMQVLHGQLCRSSQWDSTPMYAYGGLSLLAGLRHLCLLGLPLPGAEGAGASLARELGSWSFGAMRVDVAELERRLRDALDGFAEAGREEGTALAATARNIVFFPR